MSDHTDDIFAGGAISSALSARQAYESKDRQPKLHLGPFTSALNSYVLQKQIVHGLKGQYGWSSYQIEPRNKNSIYIQSFQSRTAD